MNGSLNTALKMLRKHAHIKAKDLAQDLEISAGYLSEIENGKKRPSSDLIARYAKVFGLKPSFFYLFVEELNNGKKITRLQGWAQEKMLDLMSRYTNNVDED